MDILSSVKPIRLDGHAEIIKHIRDMFGAGSNWNAIKIFTELSRGEKAANNNTMKSTLAKDYEETLFVNRNW